ncbi:hypothetical protein CXB49_09485 [Chromobacterium sp. ATCC 53434]|nr:hypothetical protein CXB49_09485 [Chromobacterium sp. ATCC 53434]
MAEESEMNDETETSPSELAPRLPEIVQNKRFHTPPAPKLGETVYIGCHFDHVHWPRCHFDSVRFVDCRFDGNHFENCLWRQTGCADSQFIDCLWKNCDLERVGWQRVTATNAKWQGGRQREFSCVELNGNRWLLDDLRSEHGAFVDCELREWLLQGGVWSDSAWIKNRIDGLHIADAEFRNFIHGQSRCARVRLHHCHGVNARWIDCELEDMALDRCLLKQSAWSHSAWQDGAIRASRLPGACFDQARLSRVRALESNLEQAMFDDARLDDCVFDRVDAPRVSLRRARLERVTLAGANMRGLDACDATLVDVDLSGCDCRQGRLIGQPPGAWWAADTKGAVFDDEKLEQDRAWRQQMHPGPRGDKP